MNAVATASHAETLELADRGLLAPSLQSEPFPIRSIAPAPCTQACPAGINVKAYISLIAEGRFAEALEVIRRRCPLPGICGRVCHHPCEQACLRGKVDEPIAIRSLKRFVADLERDFPKPAPPPGPDRNERIAVIGSGPAGLTAAYDLRLVGYPVTLFEADAEPGGMLRHGITAYRLPRDVLDAEIDVLVRSGIEIHTNRRLGVDVELEGLLSEGYRAVLLAVGAQLGRHLGIAGEDECNQIQDALAFLRRVNDGDRTPPGRRVVVIGGGSTAIEAARAALRLGAESVEILYRRYREELLAGSEEVEAAESEGVRLRFLVTPVRVMVENGRLRNLECSKVGLGEPDGSGRRRPITIPGSEFVVRADAVLAAVGQEADLAFLPKDAADHLAEFGRLIIDPATSMTGAAGIFAAGDVVTGPSTVIDAVAAGHQAAESIRHYLEEGIADIREQRPELRAAEEFGLPDAPPIEARRIRPALARPAPGQEFAEVEQAFTAGEAVAEAKRCMRCGPCGECHICASSCYRRHIMVRASNGGGAAGGPTALLRAPSNIAMSLMTGRSAPGWLLPKIHPASLPEIDTSSARTVEVRPVRTFIDAEHCRACARCVKACPFGAVSLRDGPAEHARIEPSLCRGCNLCTAVCPTQAATPTALSPEWWGSRLWDVFTPAPEKVTSEAPLVVLACQRRAGGLEVSLDRFGIRVEVIRFRCVGQVDAGMLINLHRQGAWGILVAGCLTERCRFGVGARMASEQVDRACTLLRTYAVDEGRIGSDWSVNRAGDPLDEALRRFLDKLSKRPRSREGKKAEMR